MQEATFGAGCFWGVQKKFDALPGVLDSEVGFMGGTTEHPSYQDVCRGNTHHAEVVHFYYDPAVISYKELLDAFFSFHDPTQKDAQGADRGDQYRSAIFYYTEEQKKEAQEAIQKRTDEGVYAPKTIQTVITPATTFWKAEEYHQKYLEKKGS